MCTYICSLDWTKKISKYQNLTGGWENLCFFPQCFSLNSLFWIQTHCHWLWMNRDAVIQSLLAPVAIIIFFPLFDLFKRSAAERRGDWIKNWLAVIYSFSMTKHLKDLQKVKGGSLKETLSPWMKINETMWMDESDWAFFPAAFRESCDLCLILYIHCTENSYSTIDSFIRLGCTVDSGIRAE